MNLKQYKQELDKVKNFLSNEDYEKFDNLVNSIKGDEGIEFLDCLLDSVCVEDDYGPYESLFNTIWRFPDSMVGRKMGEYLPSFQQRMSFAPFQVWRFYVILPKYAESRKAFLSAASNWDDEERKIGMNTILDWILGSANAEKEWAPIYQKLGGKLPDPIPTDPIPDEYNWSKELINKLEQWRKLPAGNTSEKVFWSGGKETQMDEWREDLPRIIEAISLRQGNKWRDVKVWLNPLSFFAKSLQHDFVEALSRTPKEIRDRAFANIERANKGAYDYYSEMLMEEFDISIGSASWQKKM